jgi:hypothetical protein
MEERLFGRVLLRTDIGDALSLDLYEPPGLTCRGVYLPPERGPESTRVPVEVELVADNDAREEIWRNYGGARSEDGQYIELATDDGVLVGEVSSSVESAGRFVWTGTFAGRLREGRGSFDFVLEQFGSIEVYFLLMLLFYLVFLDQRVSEVWQQCYGLAVQQCGEGNIKSLRVTRRVSGVELAAEGGCEVECFERSAHT